jgi:hypothetical protein
VTKITATFERYWQYKQYDGEKVVLSVEMDVTGDVDPPSAAAALHHRLSSIGDNVVAGRIAEQKQLNPKPPETARRPAEPGEKPQW